MVPDAVGIMNATLSGYPSGMPITYVNMTQDVPVPPALPMCPSNGTSPKESANRTWQHRQR